MDIPASSARHSALASELAAEIGSGIYPLGGRFPTEKDLQERFGLGRHTIREALKILTEQGLVGRRRKTGTVVLSHHPVSRYVHSLRDIRSLFDFAQSTTFDIQHEGFARISNRTADDFFDTPDTRWLRMAGVRYKRPEGSPLCWSEVLVPEGLAPDRNEVRKRERAIYEVILDQHGLKLDHVEQKVSATQLPAAMADLLGAEPGGAALVVERRYVAHNNLTFEVSQNLYPADRYSISSIIRQRS